MSFTDQMIESSIAHIPLVAAFVVAGWYGFPLMFKKTLMNGSGDIIRQIVRVENEMQSKLHQQETRQIVKDAIMEHEKVEGEREAAAHQRLMDEITDTYQLKRRSRR